MSKSYERQRRWRESAEPACTWCSIETVFVGPYDRRQHDTRTLDHRQPKAKGGRNTRSNMRVSCSLCNGLRGTETEAKFEIICEAIIKPNRHDLRAMAAAFVQAGDQKRAMVVIGNLGGDTHERALVFAAIGGVNEIASPKGNKRERLVRRERYRQAFAVVSTEVLRARLHAILVDVSDDLTPMEVLDRDAERVAAETILLKRDAEARKKKGPPEGDPVRKTVSLAQ